MKDNYLRVTLRNSFIDGRHKLVPIRRSMWKVILPKVDGNLARTINGKLYATIQRQLSNVSTAIINSHER